MQAQVKQQEMKQAANIKNSGWHVIKRSSIQGPNKQPKFIVYLIVIIFLPIKIFVSMQLHKTVYTIIIEQYSSV